MLKLTKINKQVLHKNIFKTLFMFVCTILLTDSNNFRFLRREKIRKYFCKINKFLSLTKFKKNCYMTGKSRVRSLFSLSRFKIKSLAWEGLIVGLKRAS